MSVSAFPLCWPQGRPTTPRPARARFNTSFRVARDELVWEIERLGGRATIISSNIPLRQDGLPYASAKEPDHPGVAVYFSYRDAPRCFACDQWDRVRDNLQATRKTIEALRGIARWGSGDMMARAFAGFAALPDPDAPAPWYVVLGCASDADAAAVQRAYRQAAGRTHPDKPGGSAAAFRRVQWAWEQAKR